MEEGGVEGGVGGMCDIERIRCGGGDGGRSVSRRDSEYIRGT